MLLKLISLTFEQICSPATMVHKVSKESQAKQEMKVRIFFCLYHRLQNSIKFSYQLGLPGMPGLKGSRGDPGSGVLMGDLGLEGGEGDRRISFMINCD